MPQLIGRLATVVLAAALVVGGLELAAYAANGHALLLGQANRESRTATITSSGTGPALNLRSDPRGPALAVSNSRKVVHLNADTVDGLDGRSLQTNAVTFTIPAGPTTIYALTGLKPGRYLAVFDIAMTSGNPAATCGLEEWGATSFSSVAYAPTVDGLAAVSASAIVEHPAQQMLLVNCSDVIYALGTMPNTVSLIPIGSEAAGVVGSAPASGRTGH